MIRSTKLLNSIWNWLLVSVRPLLMFPACDLKVPRDFEQGIPHLPRQKISEVVNVAGFDLMSSSTSPSTLYKCRKKHPRDVKNYRRTWVLKCLILPSALVGDTRSTLFNPQVRGRLGSQGPSVARRQPPPSNWRLPLRWANCRRRFCSGLEAARDPRTNPRVPQSLWLCRCTHQLAVVWGAERELLEGAAPGRAGAEGASVLPALLVTGPAGPSRASFTEPATSCKNTSFSPQQNKPQNFEVHVGGWGSGR